MKNRLIHWPPKFPIKEVTSHEILRLREDILDPKKYREKKKNVTTLAIIAHKYFTVAAELDVKVDMLTQLAESAEHRAETDQLTQLYSQVPFKQEMLSSLWDDRRRDPEKFCALFIMDMESLKALNETLGQNKTDIVIGALGKLIGEHIRSERNRKKDIRGRIGGDEFGIFCEDLNHRAMKYTVERILKATACYEWEKEPGLKEDGRNLRIRLHVGVTYCKQKTIDTVRKRAESMEDFEALFLRPFANCASEALIEAKATRLPVYKKCNIDAI